MRHLSRTPWGGALLDVGNLQASADAAIELASKTMTLEERENWSGFSFRIQDKWDPDNCHPKVTIIAYPIMKRTPQGYWIWDRFNHIKSFVLNGSERSRYNTDLKAALNEFRRRKQWQMEIGKRSMNQAKQALDSLFNHQGKLSDIERNARKLDYFDY